MPVMPDSIRAVFSGAGLSRTAVYVNALNAHLVAEKIRKNFDTGTTFHVVIVASQSLHQKTVGHP
jgi:hypothetical protein